MKVLQGKFICLRAPEPEDLELLYLWENDTGIWQLGNTLTPFSRYILKQFIESANQDIYEVKQTRFMIDLALSDSTKKTIGTIDLFDFDPYNNRAGIGILIADTTERGKGYASDALDTLIQYAFEILKIHQLFCNVTIDNLLSLNLFKNKGFTVIGEKKDWIRNSNGWIGEYTLQLINAGK